MCLWHVKAFLLLRLIELLKMIYPFYYCIGILFVFHLIDIVLILPGAFQRVTSTKSLGCPYYKRNQAIFYYHNNLHENWTLLGHICSTVFCREVKQARLRKVRVPLLGSFFFYSPSNSRFEKGEKKK